MDIFEIIGWVGSAFFIVSYFLLSTNKIRADRWPYQLMNVLGAICLVICAYGSQDRPNMFTNLVWMGIGLYALFRIKKQPSA